MTKVINLIFAAFLLAGCLPAPLAEATPTAALPYRITQEENPYAPVTGDPGQQQAEITLTSVTLIERIELEPPRVAVVLQGLMPSVCNELRIEVRPPDESFRIILEAYSLVNPTVQCDNVFQQFEATVLLGTFSPGRYTVWVNETYSGDFVVN